VSKETKNVEENGENERVTYARKWKRKLEKVIR
jgi:hypothetical protein